MKVAILGAGVIGVTTAYFLHKQGYEVVVIDRCAQSAAECSFSTGGQLSYNHAEPWASASSLKSAVKWIGKKDAPLLFKLRLDPHMWQWSAKFIAQALPSNVNKNTETLLRLGLYSRKVMHEMDEELSIDFDYRKTGKLFIFEDKNAIAAAQHQMELQKNLGGSYEQLSAAQCIEKEPALAHIQDDITGGIFDMNDESGDTQIFTVELTKKLEAQGVEFLYNTNIEDIQYSGSEITSISTDKGAIEADSYVIAMGSYSPIYLRKIGIKVPIYPLKGYSISVQIEDEIKVPKVSITHSKQKIVFSKLGNIFRAAGTVEFAGYNDSINADRIEMLKQDTKKIFPDCGDIENAQQWACLRPSTPDGPPILGKSRYNNLYLNIGHGTLGWTQAAASAKIVSDIMVGKEPEISLNGLNIERYL